MFDNLKFMVLWITNDCNLRCSYCYADAGEKKEYMSFETARRALKISKTKFKLQLAGGEPLLNFSLIREIHSYLQRNKPDTMIQMQTNATLITSEIAREIRRMNIAVGVSLDGPIDVNEKIRGKTSAAINGIKTLADEGIMVNINCVVTEENIEYLHELPDLALYLGNVGGIGLDLLRRTGRAAKSGIKSAFPLQIEKNVRKAYERTKELYQMTGSRILIREIEDAKKRIKVNKPCYSYCHAVYGGSMVVHPDGNMYPCGSLVNEEHYMGNIYDISKQREVRIESRKPEKCKYCKYKLICAGACPSRSIINNNSREVTEEDCSLRRVSFEIAEQEIEN